MPVSPARAAAFDILMRIETRDAYASELLHSVRFAKLSSADHGLATELVMGVLRWCGLLDGHITAHAAQPWSKLDAEVITALRIGIYQLLFLERIPAHAAINESVELVKNARKRSAAGMVNAVLRKVKRSPSAAEAAINSGAEARLTAEPSRRGAGFEPPAVVKSHPEWLVTRWEKTYGAEAAAKICCYDQRVPDTTIRADQVLAEQLVRQGVRLQPGRLLATARIVAGGEITRTKGFRERRLVIQDEGSQLVALLVGTGESILDCCAAPGGKTRILGEQNPEARVVAMDLHPHRAERLRRLVPFPKVYVLAADARTMPFGATFDRVLVDSPCTGTGTLAGNPEIKWRLKPEDIPRLRAYQLEILLAAMAQVSPGGRLLYSTCSLEPEENESVIKQALRQNGAFRTLEIRDQLEMLRQKGELVWDNIGSLVLGPYLRTIPGVHPCDGFFAALLEREL